MTKYKGTSPKAYTIRGFLDDLPTKNNETLAKMVEIIKDKVDFYEQCVLSWERPGIEEKWSQRDIEVGKAACQAGLNMAESIANEMRIEFGRK